MIQILVAYCSQQGRTQSLAEAVAAGAQARDVHVALRRVQDEGESGAADHPHPACMPADLEEADGYAFGSPVYFGAVSGSMLRLFERAADLWTRGALAGRPATVFLAAGSGAGRETATLSLWSVLATHGMIIVPPGAGLLRQASPGAPHGATPFAVGSVAASAPDKPSAADLDLARAQGRLLADVARALRAAAPV